MPVLHKSGTMNVVEISEPGGPEVLKPATRPIPQPKDDEILIKVRASGVNGPDIAQRKGLYPPPPGASDLPGLEVAGEVAATGSQVKSFTVGEEVCALTNGGGYAEYVAVPAGQCLPVPKGLNLTDAAGLPETYFTVWNNVFYQQDLPQSGNFLVHGGAGGIGSTAIQLGAAFGLNVFTTCSSSEKMAFCEAIGATRAINYKEEDFSEIVSEAGGAHIILDMLGGDYVAKNFAAAAMDARLIQVAFNRGPKVEINALPIMTKRLAWTGSTLRPRSADFKAAIASDLLDKVWPLFESGKLRAVTYSTFPLEKADEAHALMESSKHTGKILLTL